MSEWWWLALAVAAVGAGGLTLVDRALRRERRAVRSATRAVRAARAEIPRPESGGRANED